MIKPLNIGIYKTKVRFELIRFTLLFNLAIVSSSLFSQKIRIYTTEDGIQQSSVTQCLQDSKGFMWFTTGEGLSRFDGIKFKNFIYNPIDSTSVSNNSIRRMVEDNEGNLWIGSDNGLNVYQRETESFKRININNNQAVHVVSLSGNYLICYKALNGSIVKFHLKNGQQQVLYKGAIEDRFLIIGNDIFAKESGDVFVKINVITGKVHHYSLNKIIKYFNNSISIETLNALTKNQMLISTNRDNYIFNIETSELKKTSLFKNEQISDVFEDSKGNIWVGLNHKCILQLSQNLSIIDTFLISNHLNNSSFYKFFEDKSGSIWIGLEGVGVCKLNPSFLKFKSQTPLSNGLKTADASNFVWSILKTGDNLYIGTESNGLCIINQPSQKLEHINTVKGEKIKRVKSIIQGTDGRIWIGTDKGLFVQSNVNSSITKIRLPQLANKSIYELYKISIDEILIGCFEASYVLNTKTLTIEPLFLPRNLGAKYTFLDKNGNLWLQSFDLGIYFIKCFNSKKLPINFKSLQKLWSHAKILCVFESKNGMFWVGTNQGLWQVAENKINRTYGIKDGFPDEIINGILEDEANNLWISTNRGICRFNFIKNTVHNFGILDGLQSNEFNSGALFKDNENKLYFGGVNGYNSFDPNEIILNKTVPFVEIIELKIMGNRMPLNLIRKADKVLELSYFKNSISIELASLEFTFPEKNKIAFAIEEINMKYEILNNTNYLNFTSLKPGKYTIWVKSCNSDDVWSDGKHLITIIINPPFWQTLWFLIVGCFTFLTAFLFPIYYLQQRRYQKKLQALEKQKELESIKTRLAKDLHDELGSGLTKINFLTEIGPLESELKTQNTLGSIKLITQDLAEKMRELIWVMDPLNNHIDVLIARLREYSNDYLEEFPIDLEIDFPDETFDFALHYEASRNIFMSLKESLQNIVKHAGAKKVKVRLEIANDFLLCIQDDGKGFNYEEVKKGNGLLNIQSRISTLGGNTQVITEEKKGTSIKILIPIKGIKA